MNRFNSLLRSWLMLGALCIMPSALGLTVGATNDLWDVSQGTVVTASSPANSSIRGIVYSPRNLFGGTQNNQPGDEVGDFYFADGQNPGHTNFVEWRTVGPVTLKEIRVYAIGDGPQYNNQREFETFNLKAKSPGSSTFDILIYSYNATHPYQFFDSASFLLIDSVVTPVVATEFRAEFTAQAGTFFNGARIFELDGFGDPSPGAAHIVGAVNDLWDVSKGSTVTAVSPSAKYSDGRSFDPASIFGAVDLSFTSEAGNYIFSDGQQFGQTNYVEWRTPTPIILRGFQLYALGGGGGHWNSAGVRFVQALHERNWFNEF